jgi:hypothetical protein
MKMKEIVLMLNQDSVERMLELLSEISRKLDKINAEQSDS